MRKACLILVSILMASGFVTTASAQFFMSQMSDARTIPDDGVTFGGGISVFDGLIGLGGRVVIGVTDDFEFGAKLGIVNYDAGEGGNDHTGLSFGGDLKYQIMDVSFGDPVDLALGGGVEYYNTGENSTLWLFGSNAIVSYPVELSTHQVLSPLFRLNMRFEHCSVDVDNNSSSDTKFKLGFGFGAQFDISDAISFFAELIISDGAVDDGFVGGISFGL